MRWSGRRKSIIFIVLGSVGVGGAVALNIGWVIFSWREAGYLIAGLILFPLIITGAVLNTIFLVREIRRNEQHENFINAVTHELKTPLASVKLHLQTLQQHQVDESKRQEFYQVMVEDCDRLLGTVEQVLRAGRLRAPQARGGFRPVDLAKVVDECLSLAQTRYTGGITSYLEVITAEAVALGNERTEVQLRDRRMAAAVGLVRALGGGWRASDLPSDGDVLSHSTPPPPPESRPPR